MDSIVVNFFGGPGAAKSTMAADVFARLKWEGINCELVQEFAKDETWQGSHVSKDGKWEVNAPALDNQLYVFGQQHHRIFRLLGKVEVIVTDSPIILSTIYDKDNNECLRNLVLNEFNKFNNINFVITRMKKYNPMGRSQTLQQAIKIDRDITAFLNNNSIAYEYIEGTRDGALTAAVRVFDCCMKDKSLESL